MNSRISRLSLTFLLIGIAVFSYLFAKALVSSFTHDESFTYLKYVHASFIDIISFKDSFTNNHILNSLLMKLSENCFGSSVIALRLPNLLLFAVYITYSFLLFKNYNYFIAISIFILLVANSSLTDMFGLARGYGLSLGFMLMSFYHFTKSFSSNRTRNILLFHSASLCAILSSFTLIDFYLAEFLIFNLIIFIESEFLTKTKFAFFKVNKIHLIPLLLAFLILFEPFRRLITNSKLDFGGKEGFFADTFTHLIYYITQQSVAFSSTGLLLMKITLTAIVLISSILIVSKIIRRDAEFFNTNKGLIVSNFLLILISAAIILQHLIFKADYPIGRFVSFYVVLYIIHFGYFLIFLFNYSRRIVIISIVSLALLTGLNFIKRADLYTCSEWGYELETKNMLKKLSEFHEHNKSDSLKIKLGISWVFEPTINFYRQTKKMDWLIPVDRNGLAQEDDYYYVFREELNKLDSSTYKILVEYDRTNTVLLKNKKGN